MPIIERSNYQPPKLFNNGHLQTLYPYFFRKVRDVKTTKERVITPDGDFIDVEYSDVGSKNLAILSHGLEGNTDTQYIKAMTKKLTNNGFDVLAWNMRSCSGELNLKPYFYTALSIDDLEHVIKVGAQKKDYENISLVGFSLGGNLTANYLGIKGKDIHSKVSSAVLVSTPCSLHETTIRLSQKKYKFYFEAFMVTMRKKLIEKVKTGGLEIDTKGVYNIHSFKEFDDRFTAPLHGYKSAVDYYTQASCLQRLDKIIVPTLLLNAQDDPFLGELAFPTNIAQKNKNFFLEAPKTGGHVGFVEFSEDGHYWSERRTKDFLKKMTA